MLLCLLPAAAQAQKARSTSRCADTLAGAHWRLTPLSATVTDPAPGERDRDRYVTALLQKLGSAYRDPHATLLPAQGGAIVTPLEQRAAIESTLELVVDKNGKVRSARIAETSGSAALDTALVTAVRSADQGRGYGRPPRKLGRDSVRFTLRVADRDLPADALSIGGVASSYLVADVPPRIRLMPPARASQRARGKEVVLAGTVDAHGRMIRSTIRVVSTTDSTLIPIARRSMEQTTFYPGTYRGCPAESPIRFPFKF